MTDKKSKKKNKGVFLNDYSAVVEEINTPVCFLDPEGTFLLSNPACDAIFGVKKGRLVGKNLKGFVSPAVFKKIKKWIKGEEHLSQFEILKRKGNNKILYVMSSPKYDKKNKKRKYIGSLVLFDDITERKKFDCKLEEKIDGLQKGLVFKSNLLSSLLHKTPDHIYFKDKKSRFVQVSRAFVKKLGVKNIDEVIGKTDFDFFTKPHAEQAYREEQEMIKTKKPVTGKIIEETYLDGRAAWVSTTKVPWYDEKGDVIGILGISRDITETKELEKKLNERMAEFGGGVILKSNLLTSLLDNIPDLIYFKDKKSRFIRVNKAKALKAGKEEDFFIGKTDFDFFPKDEAEEMLKDEKQIIAEEKLIIEKEQKVTRPDGKEEWALVTKVPRYDEKGNIIGTLGISRDITEKKKLEEKLKRRVEQLGEEVVFKSELLSSLLDNTPDNIYFKDKKSRFIAASKSLSKWIGASSPEEMIGRTDFDYFTKEHAEPAFHDEQEIIKTGKPIKAKIEKETHPDGRITWVSTTKIPRYDKDGNIIGTLGISRDVTEKKKLEEKLKRRLDQLGEEVVLKSSLLASLLDNMPELIYFKDKKSRFVKVSKSLADWSNVESVDDLLGKTDFDFYKADEAKIRYEEEKRIMKTGKPIINKEEKHTTPDGVEGWTSTTKLPLYDEKGKVIGTFGISRDITEKKKLEEKLKRRVEQLGEEVVFKSNLLSSLLDNTPDNIYFKDKKSRFVAVSRSLSKWIGASSPEEMIGKTDFDYFTKEHAEPAFHDEQEIIKTGKPIKAKIEKETHPDGRITWVSTTKIPRYDETGKIIGTLGISRDVTQSKAIEEQLKESEAENRAILSALPDLLFQVKKDGTFLSYYSRSEDILYAKPDEFLNKNMYDTLPKSLAERSIRSIKEAIKTGETVSFEYQLAIKGSLRDWEARFAKVDKETAVVLIRDMTEMKNAEREVYRLNDLIEQSADSIMRMDKEMRINYANKTTKELFGYTFSELKGKSLEFLIAEADSEEISRNIFYEISKGKIYSGEHLSIKKDGGVFFCHVKVMPLFDEDVNIYGYMASLVDVSEERKAREELVFRENLLDSFLELTPDNVFFKDRDCRFVEVSKSQAEKYNLSRDEIIGGSDFSFQKEEIAEKYFDEEQNIMNKEKPLLDQEERHVSSDGTSQWISYTKVPRYDEDGNVVGIIGISRDITKLKKTEEELRKEEQLLSNALESMRDGILVLDQNFNYTYWNNSMEKISKVSRDVILRGKKKPWEVFPHIRETKIDDMMKQAMSGEVVQRDRIPYKLKDGTKGFTSEIYLPLKNTEGKIYGIVGVVKEVTKEIEAEETLKESEEKYRIIVENSREGICIFRADRFLFINDQLCNIVRYSKNELYKMEIWEIVSEDDRNIVREMERRREKGEEMPDVYEANIVAKNGDLRFCEFAIKKIIYQGLESFMGIIRDITEYKDMEKEREKADRLESLGVLAGGIAHDFNNFLTGILGNISLAKLHLKPQDSAYEILEESEQAAQSARSLTQQLLTFSKGGKPVKINVDVKDLVQNSANFVLSGSNVRCDFDFAEDMWNVKADRGQLSQVFNNLILNADQAMPLGGLVKIKGENIKIEEGNSLDLKEGKYVKIEIRDEGVGIPKDIISKIFDPFFTTKQKGSGLGLSTVFSIVKRHEGCITVQSELEKGTSFFVYLPAADKGKVAPKEEERQIAKGKGKILIMDDKSFVRNAAVKALKLFGYEVEGVADGTEAVVLYKEEMKKGKPFDLIILDLTIPGGMGGENTLKELRGINPKVKAIVSSGYSEDPVMSEYKKHGFNEVVRKPYQYEELCKVVGKVMKGKK